MLGPNVPNPFNPRTVITFHLARKQSVSLKIYDARGRLVRRLLEETREAGRHSMVWDGCDDGGDGCCGGLGGGV